VVRQDLPIEQQIVQAVHAAHESGIYLSPPTGQTTSVVVCSVKSEQQLLNTLDRVESRGIKTILFREPDIGNEATAFATEPIPSHQRHMLKNLQLRKMREALPC
jgi:hypothetical protein